LIKIRTANLTIRKRLQLARPRQSGERKRPPNALRLKVAKGAGGPVQIKVGVRGLEVKSAPRDPHERVRILLYNITGRIIFHLG
jgi:hypothetical protein